VLKVLENKSILSANVREALPEGYTFRGLSIEIAGTVAKDGDRFAFTARGSKQKFTLTANDELRKLVDAGKTTVAVSGKLTEKEKSSPAIEVSSAKAEK